MTTLTTQQRTAATWLLRHSKGKAEDAIRSKIQSILDSLDMDNEAGYEPPTAHGPSDIYLPRRRTFIETKAVGLANDPHKPPISRKRAAFPPESLAQSSGPSLRS